MDGAKQDEATTSATIGQEPDVEHLEPSRCWALLRAVEVGRLAICTPEGPEVFPVNFVVDGGSVVFRTGEGTKLSTALAAPTVTFEADGEQADPRRAWSVVLKGPARLIKRIPELVDTAGLPLSPWHSARKEHFVRITPAQLSGRSFRVVDPATWRTALSGAPRTSAD